MKFQDDPSVHSDRLTDLLRAMHQRYIDLALLVDNAADGQPEPEGTVQ